MRYLFLLSFFIFLCFGKSHGQWIQGPIDVCVGSCPHYYLAGISGTQYMWQVESEIVSYSSEPMLCWPDTGVFHLSLSFVVDGQMMTIDTMINVMIPDIPQIYSEAIVPSSICSPGVPEEEICEKVCPNSSVYYLIPPASLFVNLNNLPNWQNDGYGYLVHWGSAGETGSIYAEYWGLSTCIVSRQYCIEVVSPPSFSIATDPPAENNALSICQGQTVFFEYSASNEEEVNGVSWDFGDGHTSNQNNPFHTFNAPGTYVVNLSGQTDCGCVESEAASITVEVAPAIELALDCTGSVCLGDTVTYTSALLCGSYSWSVSPEGTIVGGGGSSDNFVSIAWQSGYTGVIEVEVEDCEGESHCPGPSYFHIPILSDDALIEGPTKVCRGAISSYSLPAYAGTEFSWSVSGYGTIRSGQGSNAVMVEWSNAAFPPSQQWVAVEFFNCYLECGGRDTIFIDVRPEFIAEGPREVCRNSSAGYNSRNLQTNLPFNCHWEVRDAAGNIAWTSPSPTGMLLVEWAVEPGWYVVAAKPEIPADFCLEKYEFKVLVIAEPPEATLIEGPPAVCPGSAHTYLAPTDYPAAAVRWQVNNGGTTHELQGNPVNVAWGATPPYELSVTIVRPDGPGCVSAPFSVSLEAVAGLEIAGDAVVCLDEISVYSALPDHFPDYQWTISPPQAGSITGNPSAGTVQVLWHQEGPAIIQASYCGHTASMEIEVRAASGPELVYTEKVCAGDTTEVHTIESYASYLWRNEEGFVFSAEPFVAVSPGYYDLTITDDYGCRARTTFQVEAYPPLEASISTPDPTVFCNIQPYTQMFAMSTATEVHYQWFRNGVPVGIDYPVFAAHETGDYQVEVTDENGCHALSNLISVRIDCPPGGGASNPCASADIAIDLIPTGECRTRQYEGHMAGEIPGSLQWVFINPLAISPQVNASHTYESAGFFLVRLVGEFPDQANPGSTVNCFAFKIDTILLAADFETASDCPGLPVRFTNLTTYLPIASVTGWVWDFGDPDSGSENFSDEKDPIHVFSLPGNYTVTLTATASTGCTASISKTVEVLEAPHVFFPEPAQNCQGTALRFEAETEPNVSYLNWDFGDPASGPANHSQRMDAYHVFDDAGDFLVSLEAVNVYGCRDTFTRQITVEPNGLSGNIASSLPSPFCEGDTTWLSAPPGGAAWLWSTGETSVDIRVAGTGVYSVTVIDAQGCEYVPPPSIVDVIPAPGAEIRAVEYDASGLPSAYFYNNYSVCHPEDVFLGTAANSQYTYHWSNGATGPQTEFSEERENILSVGIHEVFLSITEIASGCHNQVGPFIIEVHGLPDVPTIAAMPEANCVNEENPISVQNPVPGLTYLWNTGATGQEITAYSAGNYWVRAINEAGCGNQSEVVRIAPAPDVGRVPSGCFTRCEPDTLCFPAIPGVVGVQWYFNGEPLPGPEGTTMHLVAFESGEYFVEMTDEEGCAAVSDPLRLDLYTGTGDLGGSVYFDVNGNGVIDELDTLVGGVVIQLFRDGVLQEIGVTSQDGTYLFGGIPSVGYTLELDTLSLQENVYATAVRVDTALVGCNVEVIVNWLLYIDCSPLFQDFSYVICEGSSVTYNGFEIATDTSFAVQYSTTNCDYTETVTVTVAPVHETFLGLEACAGGQVEYNGEFLEAGTVREFQYANSFGCDSIVAVTVAELPVHALHVELAACQGASVIFDGIELAAGSTTVFGYVNSAGCDSTVTVTVAALPVDFIHLEFSVCEGETFHYNGLELAPGDSETFYFTNQHGCDSVVVVSVFAFPISDFGLEVENGCAGVSPGIVSAIQLSGPSAPFLYSVDGINWRDEPSIPGLAAGDYLLTVLDENGCKWEQGFSIAEISPPAGLSREAAITCDRQEVLLEAALPPGNGGNLALVWNDGATGPSRTVSQAGVYTLTLSNECGTALQRFDVRREGLDLEEFFYIPNAFSPNGDGVNDEFRVFPAGEVTVLAFRLDIFDRWGNYLFRAEVPDEGWNGQFRDRQMSPAVFVWRLVATVAYCGQEFEVEKKGDVALVK
jgi:gliding motility-associated-like protein